MRFTSTCPITRALVIFVLLEAWPSIAAAVRVTPCPEKRWLPSLNRPVTLLFHNRQAPRINSQLLQWCRFLDPSDSEIVVVPRAGLNHTVPMQNTSHAVMAQRSEPRDSLDDFPTPP